MHVGTGWRASYSPCPPVESSCLQHWFGSSQTKHKTWFYVQPGVAQHSSDSMRFLNLLAFYKMCWQNVIHAAVLTTQNIGFKDCRLPKAAQGENVDYWSIRIYIYTYSKYYTYWSWSHQKNVTELITLERHEMTSFWVAKRQQNKSENVADTQSISKLLLQIETHEFHVTWWSSDVMWMRWQQ